MQGTSDIYGQYGHIHRQEQKISGRPSEPLRGLQDIPKVSLSAAHEMCRTGQQDVPFFVTETWLLVNLLLHTAKDFPWSVSERGKLQLLQFIKKLGGGRWWKSTCLYQKLNINFSLKDKPLLTTKHIIKSWCNVGAQSGELWTKELAGVTSSLSPSSHRAESQFC